MKITTNVFNDIDVFADGHTESQMPYHKLQWLKIVLWPIYPSTGHIPFLMLWDMTQDLY